MKLLLENWREFVNEDVDSLEQHLINEGLMDVIKDTALSLKALKNKAYDAALKQFISVSDKISDKTIPVKEAIKKYLPSPIQVAALAAISLTIAAAGKPMLAQKVISGTVSVSDIMAALSGVLAEEKKNETVT